MVTDAKIKLIYLTKLQTQKYCILSFYTNENAFIRFYFHSVSSNIVLINHLPLLDKEQVTKECKLYNMLYVVTIEIWRYPDISNVSLLHSFSLCQIWSVTAVCKQCYPIFTQWNNIYKLNDTLEVVKELRYGEHPFT